MKIAFFASEVFPFAKTGGLADVAGALPLALEDLNQELIIIMPAYRGIEDSQYKINKFKPGILYSQIGKNLKVYFIEHQNFFNREGLYGNKEGDFKDNLERFAFYNRVGLRFLREIKFNPEIIHCNDWQTSLIPLYLKALYRNDLVYKDTKSVLTIHNLGYQGLFPKDEFPKLGLDWSVFNIDGLEFYDKINLLKGGIIFSDAITTVSPTYSKEIQGEENGFGLEGVLRKRADALRGIINGLDYSVWDPAHDNFIEKKYSPSNLEDKKINKRALQKICNLATDQDVVLFGIVSRLAQQKGFEIISQAAQEMSALNLQLVILGMGEQRYQVMLEQIVRQYPKTFYFHAGFDEALAHKIYAACDVFLMPSRYEPCGLGQMISFKYATLPLVFHTGGLADTVTTQNGFIFERYQKEALVDSMKQAIQAYKDKTLWLKLMKKGLGYNFSWKESAKKYLKLYQDLVG